MIEMRRVRLINWHNFVNDTVDFDQITYMVGVNAVGKTTILDAIRYCLTTSKNFNALGNKRSGRTLQGSVHGKQRNENFYTRPGHTVAYVGIEFLDKEKESLFTITVRVESESPEQEMRYVRQTWYISPKDCRLEDLPFLDAATNQPTSKEQFCLKAGKMPPIDRQKEAQEKICRRLGLGGPGELAKKFGEVFAMGTSVEEISDFKTFIYNYILPQPDVDLVEMRQDEVELENLEEILANAKSRAEQLKEIVDAGREARKKERDVLVNRGFVLYAENQEKSGHEERILQELERCNIQIERLEKEHQQAQRESKEALDAYEQAIRDSKENDMQKKLDGLRVYQKEVQRELREAQRRCSKFQNICAEIEDIQKQAEQYGFPVQEELLPSNIQKMPERRQRELEAALIIELQHLESELDRQRSKMIAEKENKKEERSTLLDKIRTLSEGNWFYPEENCAQIVKDAINRELTAQGMESDAKIVCELLYMVDESWQNCVEACLGGRRFDIIVEPEHYRVAKNIYEKLGKQVKTVSLLDSKALERSLSEISQVPNGTLAEKVKSENQLVEVYVQELLGRIVCCETSETLEKYPHSATRDLLRHYPYRLARLREPQRYIGQDARREQLESAKKKSEELQEDIRQLDEKQEQRRKLCVHFQQTLSDAGLEALLGGWNSQQMYEKCFNKHQQMEQEIEEYENNPMLLAARSKVDLRKKDYDEKNAYCMKIYSQLQDEKKEAIHCQEEQESAMQAAEAAREAWQMYIEKNPLYQEEVEKKYGEASATRSPQQIVRNQWTYQEKVNRALQDFEENFLKPLQREYNQKYTCDFCVGLDDIEKYQDQYEHLTKIELEKTTANLQKAKKRCKERFRQNILYRLRDGIEDAKKQFRALNRIMEKLAYGEESYRFCIGPSEDPQLAAFYRVIESSSNQSLPEEGTLEALVYEPDQAYEMQFNDLMEHIMNDLRIAAEERQQGKNVSSIELSSYVDYRQYLNCDIEITNTVTQKTTKLSRVSGDSSGGENQAPFYIAICASLLQIYQQCTESIRLVLLDEAFSKMTSDRIRPMMKMFRDMDLQVVLITTVEKASAIEPFCDITHSIIKKGPRNAICPFYRIEE